MVSNPTQLLQSEFARLQAENAQLRQDLHDVKAFVRALQSLVKAEENYYTNDDLNALLSRIVQQMINLFSATDGSLSLLDIETGELEFVIVHGSGQELIGQRLARGEGIAGWVTTHGEPCVVPDVRTDARFSSRIDEEIGFTTQSLIAAPLIGQGRVIGVLEVLNSVGHSPFDEYDQALLMLFGRFAGEALANIENNW